MIVQPGRFALQITGDLEQTHTIRLESSSVRSVAKIGRHSVDLRGPFWIGNNHGLVMPGLAVRSLDAKRAGMLLAALQADVPG